MKILELATKLKAIYDEKGDINVMVLDDNNDPYEVSSVSFGVAKKGQYPEDYDMPAGFTFVDLGVGYQKMSKEMTLSLTKDEVEILEDARVSHLGSES